MPKGLREGNYVIQKGSLRAEGRQEEDGKFTVLAGSMLKARGGKAFDKHQDLKALRDCLQQTEALVPEGSYLRLREDALLDSAYKAACFVLAGDPDQSNWKWVTPTDVVRRVNAMVDQYEARRSTFAQLAEDLRTELEAAVGRTNVGSFTSQSRAKAVASLRGKLERKLDAAPGHYEQLEDVTDLAGVRFLVYQPADVAVVRKAISGQVASKSAIGALRRTSEHEALI